MHPYYKHKIVDHILAEETVKAKSFVICQENFSKYALNDGIFFLISY